MEVENKTEKRIDLEDLKITAARIEEANRHTEELLDRVEKMEYDKILAGKAEAGVPVKEQTQDEKSTDVARDFLKGTGFDDRLFPTNKGE